MAMKAGRDKSATEERLAAASMSIKLTPIMAIVFLRTQDLSRDRVFSGINLFSLSNARRSFVAGGRDTQLALLGPADIWIRGPTYRSRSLIAP